MRFVDFNALNARSEQALTMTRNARDLDRESARRVSETAAEILHAIVSEFSHSRLHIR